MRTSRYRELWQATFNCHPNECRTATRLEAAPGLAFCLHFDVICPACLGMLTLCLITACLCVPRWSAAQTNTNLAVRSVVGKTSPCAIGVLQEVRANVHDL